MPQRLYYMHPVNTYGTDLERQQLEFLAKRFPGWEIVNPNTPEHDQAYNELKAKTGNGMIYFVRLAASCHGGVLLPFSDGQIGAGIWKEAMALRQRGCLVWELDHRCKLKVFCPQLNPERRLDVPATRERIRFPDGSSRPY